MIGMDKMYHFLGGLGTCLIISFVASYLGLNQPEAYGLISAFLIGALKEAFDVAVKYFKAKWPFKEALRYFDMYDFLATCLGGFVGVVVVQILK